MWSNWSTNFLLQIVIDIIQKKIQKNNNNNNKQNINLLKKYKIHELLKIK